MQNVHFSPYLIHSLCRYDLPDAKLFTLPPGQGLRFFSGSGGDSNNAFRQVPIPPLELTARGAGRPLRLPRRAETPKSQPDEGYDSPLVSLSPPATMEEGEGEGEERGREEKLGADVWDRICEAPELPRRKTWETLGRLEEHREPR